MSTEIFEVINSDAGERLAQRVESAYQIASGVVHAFVTREGDDLIDPLRDSPGDPIYPIRWKTARQRRAFFATNGFGRGIPSPRTYRLEDNWSLFVVDDTANGVIELYLTSPVPYEKFVTGVYQQPFHKDTGWYNSKQEAGFMGREAGYQVVSDLVDAFDRSK